MNRNKLEAFRLKAMAEKMITSEDYMGARDKLIEAEKLCPTLDNISSMLTVCDILCAASIRFPGAGMDYYWVLQLRPLATDSDLKAQCVKFVSRLKPINNKFPGTDLALKLLQESFVALSDREGRRVFDMKRARSWDSCGSLFGQKESTSNDRIGTAQSSSADKRVVCSNEVSDESNVQELIVKRARLSEAAVLANGSAHGEGISPEEASCVSAQVTADGKEEVDRATCGTSSLMTTHSTSLTSQAATEEKRQAHFFNFENERKDELFEVGQIWAAHYRPKAPRYARIDLKTKSELSVTWLKPVPFTPDERKWCEAGYPVACGSFELDPELSEVEVIGSRTFSQLCSWVHGVTEEQFVIYPKAGEVWAVYNDWDLSDWPSNPDSLRTCEFKIVEIVTDYSKYVGAVVTCLVKVEGFRSVFRRDTDEGTDSTFSFPPNNLYMFSHKIPAFRFMGCEMDGVADGMFELDPLALPNNFININTPEEDSSSNLSSLPQTPAPCPPITSNNQSLKCIWSLTDFSIGQVWAIYSAKNVMPRCYAIINDVVSDCHVSVTLLEPNPILDYEIHWEKENLPIACGVFRIGKTVVNLELAFFSHLVKCQRSTNRSFYKIYPRKGEIWAMYRFWNKKWNEFNFNSCQYRLVEILSDFSEDIGIKVARLAEVKGCMTFFQRHCYDGFELIRTVSNKDMLSFSHRIPAFIVPGIQRYGVPENSLHLEPDALPPRLGANFSPLM